MLSAAGQALFSLNGTSATSELLLELLSVELELELLSVELELARGAELVLEAAGALLEASGVLPTGVLEALLLDAAEDPPRLGVDDDVIDEDVITESVELALEWAGMLLLEALPILAVDELVTCTVELLVPAVLLGLVVFGPSDEPPPQALRARVHIPVITNRRIVSLRSMCVHLIALPTLCANLCWLNSLIFL